jgi:hypothetical protein
MQNEPNFLAFFTPKDERNFCCNKGLRQKLQFCNFPKTNPKRTQTKPNLYRLGSLGNFSPPKADKPNFHKEFAKSFNCPRFLPIQTFGRNFLLQEKGFTR